LPRELGLEEQKRIAHGFAQQVLGERFVYTLAIHDKERPGRPANPHVHLMWNDRMLDGVERARDGHFKRYNCKNPERGGCKKDQSLNVGRGRGCERLVEMRHAWQVCVNRELELAKVKERIDMRSYREQGIEKMPQVHLGPGAHSMELRGVHTLRGDYNREVKQANLQLQKIEKVKALDPEEVIQVYKMAKEVAQREPQTWEMKIEASEKAGEVSEKRERVEVLGKELELCLEREPTVSGKGFDPIAEAGVKLEQAKQELVVAQVRLEEWRRDPQVIAEAKAEALKEARQIEAAREGVVLLRPQYELAQIEIEIQRLEKEELVLDQELGKSAGLAQDAPGERQQALEPVIEHEQQHQVAKVLPQPAELLSSNPDHVQISRLPTLEESREIIARIERERRQVEPEPGASRELSRDEQRLLEAQQLSPREFLKQYTLSQKLAAREPRSVEAVCKGAQYHQDGSRELAEAGGEVKRLERNLGLVEKQHSVKTALGLGEAPKLRQEIKQVQQRVDELEAKLAAFEKDPHFIEKHQAVVDKEAKSIEAARHEVELLRPVYEQAMAEIKLERQHEKDMSKGLGKGRGYER